MITIKINNWEKFQPRQARQLKHSWWFALSNDIGIDLEIRELNDAEFRCWIMLLAYASKSKKDSFSIKPDAFVGLFQISGKIFNSTLKKASEFGWIALTVHDQCTKNARTEQNRTEQDKTELATLACSELEKSSSKPIAQVIHGIKVKDSSFKEWVKLYESEDWVRREIHKAKEWTIANPRRAPKSDYNRFVSSWLRRAWEYARRSAPSGQRTKSIQEILREENKNANE